VHGQKEREREDTNKKAKAKAQSRSLDGKETAQSAAFRFADPLSIQLLLQLVNHLLRVLNKSHVSLASRRMLVLDPVARQKQTDSRRQLPGRHRVFLPSRPPFSFST
jgi:hypothetical protein